MEKAAQRRKKQEWAIEKPKFEYARNFEVNLFDQIQVKITKNIIKNSRRKLETPMTQAMPCKREFLQCQHSENRCPENGKIQGIWSQQNLVVLLKRNKELISRQTGFGKNRIPVCITIVRQTTSPQEGPNVTLKNRRLIRAPTLCACPGKSWLCCRRRSLAQFDQRVAINHSTITNATNF